MGEHLCFDEGLWHYSLGLYDKVVKGCQHRKSNRIIFIITVIVMIQVEAGTEKGSARRGKGSSKGH